MATYDKMAYEMKWKEEGPLRRLTALLCALALLGACVRAETVWTEDAWADVRAELYSGSPDPVPETYRVAASSAASVKLKDDGGLTILLMASDAPDMDCNFGRTDLMLLCRMDYITGDIRLISLPEEAMVAVPGLPGNVMLRHVNCFGGPRLVLDTVNGLLDARAFRYCAVNYDAFRQIVDLLGGIGIRLTEGEAWALDLEPGENTLSGDQAIAYARLRQPGDGSPRAETLMKALADAWTARGTLADAYRALDLLLPLVDTNLTTKDLVTAAVNIVGRTTPGTFSAGALHTDEDGYLGENARDDLRAFLEPGKE